MSSLQDLGFLLAIGFGFLSLPYFRKLVNTWDQPSTPSNGNVETSFERVAQLVRQRRPPLAIPTALAAASIVIFFLQSRAARDPVFAFSASSEGWFLLSDITVNFVIGVLAGLFVRSLFDYLSTGEKRSSNARHHAVGATSSDRTSLTEDENSLGSAERTTTSRVPIFAGLIAKIQKPNNEGGQATDPDGPDTITTSEVKNGGGADTKNISAFMFFARLVPAVVLICVGILRDELRLALMNTNSINTPYIHVQFERNTQTQTRTAFEKKVENTATYFQHGLFALRNAATSPFGNLDRIMRVCGSESLAPNCSLPEISEAGVMGKTMQPMSERGKELNNYVEHLILRSARDATRPPPDRTLNGDVWHYLVSYIEGKEMPLETAAKYLVGNEKLGKRTNAFIESLDFGSNVKYIDECLIEFGRRFPNGVPILDEISELASDYTIFHSEASEDLGSPRQSSLQLEKVIRRVLEGGQVAAQEDNDKQEKCKFEKEKSKEVIKRFKRSHLKYLISRSRETELHALLPYRTIYNSNLLLMAGHAAEASNLLDHKIKIFEHDKSERYGDHSSAKMSFPEFVFSLQLYSHSDNVHDVVAKKGGPAASRDELPEKLDALKTIISDWVSANTNVRSFDIEPLLKSCASHDLHFVNGKIAESEDERASQGPENTEARDKEAALDEIQSSEEYVLTPVKRLTGMNNPQVVAYFKDNDHKRSKVDEINYIRRLIMWYLEKQADWVSATAAKNEDISRFEVEAAAELLRISLLEPDLIYRCYNYDPRPMYHRQIRATFAFSGAELLAFYAQQLQSEEIAQQTLGYKTPKELFSRKNLCMSDAAFRLARQYNEDAGGVQKGSEKTKLESRRISDFLVQIGVGTCNFEESSADLQKLID